MSSLIRDVISTEVHQGTRHQMTLHGLIVPGNQDLQSEKGPNMGHTSLSKILTLVFLLSAFSDTNEETYTYEEDLDQSSVMDYENEGNETEEYESFAGRDGEFLTHEQTRPAYPLNHYLSDKNHLHELSTLLNYHHKHRLRPSLKRKSGVKRHHFKHLLPLLLTALAKVAHFIPVVKLTLLALFALVLFSKKALLVSLGSLILVIYDTFYKGKHQHHNTNNVGLTVVKDRGSTVPTVEHGIHSDEHKIETSEEPWYGREEVNPPKINPREDISNSDKWKRWWAPQINSKKKPPNSRGMRDELYENLEDIIYNF